MSDGMSDGLRWHVKCNLPYLEECQQSGKYSLPLCLPDGFCGAGASQGKDSRDRWRIRMVKQPPLHHRTLLRDNQHREIIITTIFKASKDIQYREGSIRYWRC